MSINLNEDIKRVLDWLAVRDTVEKTDLIFLFGGSVLNIAQKGAELMNQGLAPYILTTGENGTFGNPNWSKPSAEIFKDYLIEHGVNVESILIQNKSTNTLEDVQLALPILENKGIKINSIILVSRPVHQRRAYATFKKQFPYHVKVINQPCDENIDNLTIEEIKEVGKRCVQEYDRLIKYGEKGDLATQVIPEEITRSVQSLRQSLLEPFSLNF